MMYIALHSYNGTVTDKAYQKGLRYNEVILKNKTQASLGWKSNIQLKKIKDKEYELSLHLLDENSMPIKGAIVKSVFGMSISDKFDKTAELKYNNQQQYYANKIKIPKYGKWEIRIHSFVGDIDYFDSQTIVITK